MDSKPTFGEQFLEEVRKLTGANPLDYATTQRVKGLEREEVVELLRKNAGATYADIQRLRTAEDPREMAQFLFDAQRRSAASGPATMFWIGLMQ
ncbi:MAG: hypothetical protein NTV21_14805 [Planctomycetota bacterium]|nr:hypothetical protein [Planctomycetota bacterium]